MTEIGQEVAILVTDSTSDIDRDSYDGYKHCTCCSPEMMFVDVAGDPDKDGSGCILLSGLEGQLDPGIHIFRVKHRTYCEDGTEDNCFMWELVESNND